MSPGAEKSNISLVVTRHNLSVITITAVNNQTAVSDSRGRPVDSEPLVELNTSIIQNNVAYISSNYSTAIQGS